MWCERPWSQVVSGSTTTHGEEPLLYVVRERRLHGRGAVATRGENPRLRPLAPVGGLRGVWSQPRLCLVKNRGDVEANRRRGHARRKSDGHRQG